MWKKITANPVSSPITTGRAFLFLVALLAVSSPAFAFGSSLPDEYWIVIVFHKGGPVMWAILACSVLAVAITAERLWFLRKKNFLNPSFLEVVQFHWQTGDHKKALRICRDHDIAISRIVRAGLLRADMGILEIERAIEGAGGHESLLLVANLRWLGALANISTLLGLLGTVTGMIRSFNAIAASGPGSMAMISTGISEALIATAAGLAVGIPTFAAYHFLRGRADRIILALEDVSIAFVEDTATMMAGRVEAKNR